MNILILSWRGPGHPIAGGAEQVTAEHAKFWIKAGHSVTLFTSSFKGSKEFQTVSGIKVIRRGNQVFSVHARAFLWYLFGNHEKFDLVVDEIHGISFFTPLYVRVKKLAFIHEVGKEVWKLNPWPKPFNLIPAVVGSLFEPLIFKLYRNIPFMTVSESTRRDLINWGVPTENITVVHSGINLKKSRIFPKEKIKTVMYLGALARDKGIEDALLAFADIYSKENSWQFWIVGKTDQSYGEYLKSMCAQLKIESKVKFWGYVTDIKKQELLSRAHVLINPSIREGWGLVNIEANAMGTPVVAYDSPGIIDSVANDISGSIVSKQSGPEGLSNAIIALVGNSEKYQKMQRSVVDWSKKYSWSQAGKKSLDLIGSITALNILLLSWRGPFDPNSGGAEYVAHEHAKAWVKEGNNVTLFTSFFPGAKNEEYLDGVKIIRKGYVLLGVHIAACVWYLFGNHKKFDLVIDHFHGIPFFTPLYVRVKKLAVIHEVAREVWMINQVRFPLNLIFGAIGYVTEPIIFYLFYRNIPFLTGSNSTKDELESLGIPQKNISIVHHAISTTERKTVKNKAKVATFLGSLARDKGIEDAIRVFQILNTASTDWNFWIIGKGDEKYVEYLKKMIADFGITKKVKFWGFVSNEKKMDLLSKSFVLINPSIKEGWGLVNIEANAMGTPVIGYNVSGTRDSVVDRKTGMLSQSGDYRDMAKNILTFVKDSDLYNRDQKECITWSNKFKWDFLTKESSKLIHAVIRGDI